MMGSKRTVLLINPWIYDFAAYDFWIKPLGLLYLASLLKKNRCSVRFIDCLNPHHPKLKNHPFISQPARKCGGHGKFPKERISKPRPLRDVPRSYHRYGITPGIFADEILNGAKPDVVLVTGMMTYWYPGVVDAIDVISNALPGVPIVLGGNYATFCTAHAADHSGADFVISGEGEKEIPLLFRNIFNDDFGFLPDLNDLDSYPFPALDLIPFLDHVPILTSRGCPFRCTYCASHLLSPRFRRRDPYRVVDEVSFWHRLSGVRDFCIYDDAFLYRPEEMAIPFLQEIIRRGLECRFHCPNGLHLREVNDNLAGLLFKAGFATIRFGFETSNPDSQSAMGGKATNENLIHAVQALKRAGYDESDIGVYILCGLPRQSAEEVRESILFVRSCGARPIIAEFSPIPGTVLWEDCLRSSAYSIAEEPLYHNNSLLPCRGEHLTYEDYMMMKRLTRDLMKMKST